jgi:DNA repair protein RadC
MNNVYIREKFTPSNPPPRQRLIENGPEILRDEELLLLLLNGSEQVVKKLLEEHSIRDLFALSLKELSNLLNQSVAIHLCCMFELAKRILNKGIGIAPAICAPADTLPYLAAYRDLKKEQFICLYLNARNQVIHMETISIGSLSASIVHPREVYQAAIANPCASIVLAHNHPSGDPTPSHEDIELTRRLKKAGEILGIDVLDHIIVAANDYVSFKEKDLLS